MFCPHCGKEIADNAAFCEHCGQTVQQTAQPIDQVVLPPDPAPMAPPMKWFKFLIYFSLFAGAVLNLINGISTMLGTQYGEYSELVYSTFEALRPFDLFCGIYLILMAGFSIYARFRLAQFRKNGPTMLTLVYIAAAVFALIQVAGSMAILPQDSWGDINFTSVISTLASNIFWIVINHIYFKKRAYLFVN